MPRHRRLLESACTLLPFLVFGSHVICSPYTKVEESFTIHAVWDALARGIASDVKNWDHVMFPGAVPRSFLLPQGLALLCYPFAALGVAAGIIKTALQVQVLVRLVLASLHAPAFNDLAATVQYRFGTAVRNWFLLLSLSQFHIPYYAGRTLPNFVAMPGVLFAISCAIRASTGRPVPLDAEEARRSRAMRGTAISLLTFFATNTRLELAALVVPMTLFMGLSGRVSFWGGVFAGAIGGFAALVCGSSIDGHLWSAALPNPSWPTFTQKWQLAWPELASFQYNLLQGQSANWGVMPWHHYITNSLPKLCMASLPLVMLGLVLSAGEGLGWRIPGVFGGSEIWKQVGAKVGDVGRTFEPGVIALLVSMSCIGHKEWRFIVYMVPIINVEAALVAAAVWRTPSRLRPLLRAGLLAAIGLNIVATGFMTRLSTLNYPGGEVDRALERLGARQDAIVHFTPGPLQTGATLFTFGHQALPESSWPFPALPPPAQPLWQYLKSEDPALNTPEGAWAGGVDYIVTDDRDRYLSAGPGSNWTVAGTIDGLAGVSRKGASLRVRRDSKIAILKRS